MLNLVEMDSRKPPEAPQARQTEQLPLAAKIGRKNVFFCVPELSPLDTADLSVLCACLWGVRI